MLVPLPSRVLRDLYLKWDLLFPASITSFRCFLMRMDPLRVHRVVLRGTPVSSHCGACAGAVFFSLTQMSISAKRKHSSSCHDTLSLPTLSVPYNLNLPKLSPPNHRHVSKQSQNTECILETKDKKTHRLKSSPCQLSTRVLRLSVISSKTSGDS